MLLAAAVLGCTTMVMQTIILREFLAVFCGNELVIGIVLANWMVLTGIGSLLGRYPRGSMGVFPLLGSAMIAVGLLPAITVFLLNDLRNVVFRVGVMIGLGESVYGSFLLLMPFCLASGYLFTRLAIAVSEHSHANRIAQVYLLEAAGSIVGGLLLNLLMIPLLTTFQTLLLLGLISLGAAMLLWFTNEAGFMRVLPPLIACAVIIVAVSLDLDRIAKERLFPGQKLLLHRGTPYGDLAITEQGDQRNFYENSTLLFSANDPVAREEAVHYAMIQHPRPRRVLLISGGISGTTEEILKYGVERVDYVELDPALIEIGRSFTKGLNDERIRVVNEDARRYVKHAPEQYDVVLVNVPDPGTAQINRYYTIEFLRELKKILSPGGVVEISLLPSTEYLGGEGRAVSSVLFATLRSCFHHVIIVPGTRNFFISSDRDLNTGIGRMVSERGISNTYVNEYYIDDQMMAERSGAIERSLSPDAALNSDFTPVAYYRQLLYWLSYFKFDPLLAAAVLAVVIAAITGRLSVIRLGMFTGGFAASALEVVLLVTFQALFGYLYRATGIIITAFMAGLALGAFLGGRMQIARDVRSFVVVQWCVAAYAIILPFVLRGLQGSEPGEILTYLAFLGLTIIVALLTGFEFAVATYLQRGALSSVASSLYGIDLIGSAFGALIVSAYLIPLLGIIRVSYAVALMVMGSSIVTLSKRKQFPAITEQGIAYV